MDSRKTPAWWQCYLIGLLGIVLLFIDYSIALPHGTRQLVAGGILIGWSIVTGWWLRNNREALAHEARQKCSPHPRSDPRPREVPLSRLQANYLNVMEKYPPNGESRVVSTPVRGTRYP